MADKRSELVPHTGRVSGSQAETGSAALRAGGSPSFILIPGAHFIMLLVETEVAQMTGRPKSQLNVRVIS